MATTTIDLGTISNTTTEGNGDFIITTDPGDLGAHTLTLGTAAGGFGNRQITLGDGSNTLTLNGGADQLVAGAGNNTITATGSGADTIAVDSGNNTMTLGDGADMIAAGNGNNTMTLGNGADAITAGNGNNTMTLGNGADAITAGNGNNTMTLGDGADAIMAGNGNNTITTGLGSNVITVGMGFDTITTGGGNNTVTVTIPTTLVTADAIHGASTTGNGGGNTLVLANIGIFNASLVNGFQTYQLSSAGPNTLTLADANFVNVPDGTIIVNDGNSGDTVSALGVASGHNLTVHAGTGIGNLTGGSGTNTVIFADPITDYMVGTLNGVETVQSIAGLPNTTENLVGAWNVLYAPPASPAPLAPTELALAAASDSGVSQTDDITNVIQPTVIGAGVNGDTVTLFEGTTVLGSGAVSGGVWSIATTVALAVGDNAITATQTDRAGNISSASSPLNVTLDTAVLPPAALAVRGNSNASGTLLTITGTGENGAAVTLFDGSTTIGTSTVTGGFWSIATTVPLAQGPNTITARQTDLAGNTSTPSSTLTVTPNANLPSVTAVTIDLGTISNTTTEGNGDFIITTDPGDLGAHTLTLGTAAGGFGNRQITLGDGSNTLTLNGGADQLVAGAGNNTITATGSGADTIAVDSGNNTMTLGDGADMIAAGNGNNTMTLGNGADAITAGNGNNTMTLGNGADAITAGNGNNTMTLGDGADAIMAGNGNNTITTGLGSNVITVGMGFDTITTGGGNNTVTVTIPTTLVTADAIHGASTTGNGGGNTLVLANIGIFNASLVNGFQTYQLSSAGPNTLTLADANFVNVPDGTIIVNDGNSGDTVSALGVASGHNLTVHAGTGIGNLTGGSGTNTVIFADPITDYMVGTLNGVETVQSIAGLPNTTENLVGAWNVLYAPPASPAPLAPTELALAAASDSGVSQTDDITNVIQPTVIGAGVNGDTVTLFEGTTVLGSGAVSGGVWSIATTVALAVGDNAITATQTDRAGNISSASSPLNVTLDTAVLPPAALAVRGNSNASGTLLTITGTGENGAAVTLFDGSTTIGTSTVTGGFWSIATTVPLAQGPNTITARQTDLAGNTSTPSSTLTVTPNANLPSVTAVTIDLGTISNTTTEGNGDFIITTDPGDLGAHTLTLGTAAGGFGNRQITLGDGSNTLTLNGGADQLVAGAGNNTITATGSGADTIAVDSGNNTMTLGDGADMIAAGNGNNTMTLGNGADAITAGNGNNTMTLGDGADAIMAGNGNNTITTGLGSNVITVGMGFDTITTGGGNNTVTVTIPTTLVTADAIHGASTTGNGGGNTLVLANIGIFNASLVNGFQTYQLSSAGPNTLTLADANFVNVPDGTIIVNDGNSGDTVSALGVASGHNLTVHAGTGIGNLTGGSGTNTVIFADPITDYMVGTLNGVETVQSIAGLPNTTENLVGAWNVLYAPPASPAPLAPTELALAAASDSGVSQTDDITNVIQPTVIGAGVNGVANLANNDTMAIAGGGSLDVSAGVDPPSSGIFQLGGQASHEISAALGVNSEIQFLGLSDKVTIDSPTTFGTSVGAPSHASSLLENFAAGDVIDIKGIIVGAGLGLNYSAASGDLHVTGSGSTFGTLLFQNSSLGAGISHAASDGAGGTFITHS